MVKYVVIFSKYAEKDKKLLKQAGLESKTLDLLNIISKDPYKYPPNFEKLRGNLSGFFSRRISFQHRLVYQVDEEKKVVFVARMWTHYDKVI